MPMTQNSWDFDDLCTFVEKICWRNLWTSSSDFLKLKIGVWELFCLFHVLSYNGVDLVKAIEDDEIYFYANDNKGKDDDDK